MFDIYLLVQNGLRHFLSPVVMHKAECAADFLGQHRSSYFAEANQLSSIEMLDRPSLCSYHKQQKTVQITFIKR